MTPARCARALRPPASPVSWRSRTRWTRASRYGSASRNSITRDALQALHPDLLRAVGRAHHVPHACQRARGIQIGGQRVPRFPIASARAGRAGARRARPPQPRAARLRGRPRAETSSAERSTSRARSGRGRAAAMTRQPACGAAAPARTWGIAQEASIHRVQPVRVVVVGSLNMDLIVNVAHIPKPGETVIGDRFFRAAGGKGANQAVAAARLGAQVSMIGRVGHDSFGRDLTRGLRDEGVSTRWVLGSEHATGVALIEVDDYGENSHRRGLGGQSRLAARGRAAQGDRGRRGCRRPTRGAAGQHRGSLQAGPTGVGPHRAQRRASAGRAAHADATDGCRHLQRGRAGHVARPRRARRRRSPGRPRRCAARRIRSSW